MPSSLHETLVDMFRQRPTLAADLLTDVLHTPVPAHDRARVEPGDLTDVSPTEYRADTVVVLRDDTDTPVLGVVIEVQLHRKPEKRWSWPVYLATLRARHHCPTTLLVICTDPTVATWCATPIELGPPDNRTTPLVLGPDQIPLVTDTGRAAANPELAVLSAMAHGPHPDRHQVLDALPAAFATIDPDRALLYYDYVLAALPAAVRRYLEAIMTTGTHQWQSDFAIRHRAQGRAEGHAEGRAEGEAKAVLAFLEARRIPIPAEVRTRVTACTDLDQLDLWIRRAATATATDDLFD